MITYQQGVEPRSDAGEHEAWPPQWMLDLERAHDRLGRAAHLLESGAQSGPVDLAPAAAALERVFAGIFDAYDERRSRADATRDAIGALDEAIEALTPAAAGDAAVGFAVDYLREARPSLARALDRVLPLVTRPPQAVPDMRAGFERPVLHAVERPVLTPRLRVPSPKPVEVEVLPPPIERPKTFEDLERITRQLKEAALAPKPPRAKPAKPSAAPEPDPPPGFARDIRPALTEEQFVRQRVRECFEEVSMIGVQRAPLLGDPWRASRVLERRMLYCIDAIVAMGPRALSAIESMVLDAPLKDPPRVFAAAMILGCVAGRDALAMAERVFAAFEVEDPEHAIQLGAALKLVPHPLLPVAARTFLADPDPARRALAIDVLAYRGMATPEELARAGLDEPPVAMAALPWLAVSRHAILRQAVDAALQVPAPRLRSAARLAMLLGGDMRAVSELRHALDGEPEEAEPAASLLGIAGGPAEAEILLERARAEPTRASVAAVGWAGSPASIPALIGLLGHADEPVVLAAAYALDRITNAGLHEDAIVEAEEIVAPDLPEPDVGEPAPPPLARVVSDPRDLPAEPSTDTLRRPSTDAQRWRAWWQEKSDGLDAKARYRRGYPYTPLVSWRELDLWPCTPGERRLLHWELVARTGDHVRFDVHDFVPVQEESVAEWEAVARRASGSPGSWNLPGRRSL
jgi:HEAT repeat protein